MRTWLGRGTRSSDPLLRAHGAQVIGSALQAMGGQSVCPAPITFDAMGRPFMRAVEMRLVQAGVVARLAFAILACAAHPFVLDAAPTHDVDVTEASWIGTVQSLLDDDVADLKLADVLGRRFAGKNAAAARQILGSLDALREDAAA